jgi:Mce-associated membrane protein
LDISTGQFHDDFANRAETFKQVVRDAHSVSEGTVSGAGLETLDGDRARVLIAITVKTTNANEPQQEPRHWRMRIDIEKTGDTYKASNVEFVS